MATTLAALATPHAGAAVLGMVLALASTSQSTTLATALMLIVVLAEVVAGNFSPVAALSGFAAGFASDLALNLYFRGNRARSVRGARLREYFDAVGALPAAVFAGAITVALTLGTLGVAAALGVHIPANAADLPAAAALCAIGFVVGAAVGVFSQPSRALRPLLPFYQSTSGNLENRTWDGASQAWAMIFVVLAAMASPSGLL